MPYKLEDAGEGKAYVIGPSGRKSKKPLSHATAVAQMRALYANEPAAKSAPNLKRGGKAKLTSKKKKKAALPPPDDMMAVNSVMGGQSPVPPVMPGDTSGMPTPGYENGGKFIQSMHMHKGGLHESLGIPQGEKIPQDRIAAAAKRPGKVGKQARLAEVFAGMHHGHAEHLGKKLLS